MVTGAGILGAVVRDGVNEGVLGGVCDPSNLDDKLRSQGIIFSSSKGNVSKTCSFMSHSFRCRGT